MLNIIILKIFYFQLSLQFIRQPL